MSKRGDPLNTPKSGGAQMVELIKEYQPKIAAAKSPEGVNDLIAEFEEKLTQVRGTPADGELAAARKELLWASASNAVKKLRGQ